MEGISTRTFEIKSSPSHNFHGEKADIRSCSEISDFIQTSVATIEEYVHKSSGSIFLPVIVHVPSEILARISSDLESKKIKYFCHQNWYNDSSDGSESELPVVRFLDIQGIDGLEFAVVVILLYDDGSGDRRVIHYFHTMITRACVKLVIVKVVDKPKQDQQRKKAINYTFGKNLKGELEKFESNSLVLLVGTYFRFNFITPITQSEVVNRSNCQPKIKRIQYFNGPNNVIILQLEDLYKKKHLEELKRIGLRTIILVGARHSNYWSWNFYWHTDRILHSNAFCGQFEVRSLLFLHDNYDQLSIQLERSLNKNESHDNFELQNFGKSDDIFKDDQLLKLNEPYLKWENWKEKAKESRRLSLPTSRVSAIYNDCLNLMQKGSIKDPEKYIKLYVAMCQLYLTEISKPVYSLKDLDIDSEEYNSFQCFAFGALTTAGFVLEQDARCVEAYHQIYRAIKVITNKQASGCQELEEDDINETIQKSEEDLRHANTTGLRNLDLLHANIGPTLSEKCDLLFLKRKDYENEADSDTLFAKRKELAEITCELAIDFLNQITESGVSYHVIEFRLNPYLEVLSAVLEQPIRCALESLEWNPRHEPAFDVLKKSFAFYTLILNEVYNIATKIEKRKSLAGSRLH